MPAPARSEPAVDSTTPDAPAAGASLGDWLAYVERTHPSSIALGLDRVRRVYERLGLHLDCPVITVAGTNGKGSTCAMLDAILRAAGYRSALYTSPHLIDFNERARIDGRAADDATLVRALERVEAARNDGEAVALTYFEFTTLAILLLFCEAQPDCAILEIGLGGRLDAVNIVDADCAILTSVDLDHQDFLGGTREAIGFEKAHVFRPGRPAVCADPRPPASVAEVAGRIGADLLQLGRDFGFAGQHDRQVSQWKFWMHRPGGAPLTRNGLAYPALRGANQLLNAAAALAALETLRGRLPVAMQAIRAGLLSVDWPGRFQLLPGRPVIVLDVAHNPHAAAALADNLTNIGFASHTHAVFGMLADKDIAGVARLLAGRIDTWHVAALPGPRGCGAAEQAHALRAGGVVGEICEYADPVAAFAAAQDAAGEGDRIVVFGSFLTVAAVTKALRRPASGIPSDDGGSRVRK